MFTSFLHMLVPGMQHRVYSSPKQTQMTQLAWQQQHGKYIMSTSNQCTAALYLEEAVGAQRIQSIHSVCVEGGDILAQSASLRPRSSICIWLIHDVHNQVVLQHRLLPLKATSHSRAGVQDWLHPVSGLRIQINYKA